MSDVGSSRAGGSIWVAMILLLERATWGQVGVSERKRHAVRGLVAGVNACTRRGTHAPSYGVLTPVVQ